MTDDLAALPWTGADSPATVNVTTRRKCRRHEWTTITATFFNGVHRDLPPSEQYGVCYRCGAVRDPAASRRGMSARRLGGDQERRIERVYGPRKVGEYGDACDHLGRDFKWQSKATRSLPPKWLAAITEIPTWRGLVPKSILDPMVHMTGIGGTRRPLVIRSYVRQGVATRDWLFVTAADWARLHGLGSWRGTEGWLVSMLLVGYLVIPGDYFLEIHGRDSE